ncbi:MAG: TetR/AcrR family transcriptional regulator [Treponema sp.]|jgi:AcrR family transcriptional regulator|nr:TetR/AcrR family transcriptional regulator [Treponema sp.]
MSIVVEHEKRRKEILEKALDVFVEEGFENATFQKIAVRCGITRTTLYIYFKHKKEIFNYSIKLLLLKVEEDIQRIRSDTGLNSVEKITRVLLDILRRLEENRRLLSVILDYLLYLSKSDANPQIRIRRRTLKLRHILASMVIEGIKAGELNRVNIKTADDYLYSFIEAAIFQLVVMKPETVGNLREAVIFAVRQFARKDDAPAELMKDAT